MTVSWIRTRFFSGASKRRKPPAYASVTSGIKESYTSLEAVFVEAAMQSRNALTPFVILAWFVWSGLALAEGLLDGRVFTGMIGPVENPDLEDSLYFRDGYFWSEICTRCGFLPGTYTAEKTEGGIAFNGTLESDSRGHFEYAGFVRDNGEIEASILWQRKRWYWTARREIAFQGTEGEGRGPLNPEEIRMEMDGLDPETDPSCTRL